MNHRRAFFQSVAGAGLDAGGAMGAQQSAAEGDREYWLRMLGKLAAPVLNNLAAGA